MLTFLSDVRDEVLKVSWPTREEVRRASALVLATLAILATVVALLDWGLSRALLEIFER